MNDNDDLNLVKFLQQHQAIAPQSSIDLEEQIMAEVNRIPIQVAEQKPRQWLKIAGWGLSATIATIGSIFLYQSIESPQMNMAEIKQVEEYLEAHWDHLDPHQSSLEQPNAIDDLHIDLEESI
jgi:hypothetical protein